MPGVSADSPPKFALLESPPEDWWDSIEDEEDKRIKQQELMLNRRRAVVARVLWPDLFPPPSLGWDDESYVRVSPALINRACQICTEVAAVREVARKDGNWVRRRTLLMCLLASEKPEPLKRRRSTRGASEWLLRLRELQKTHYPINRLVLEYL